MYVKKWIALAIMLAAVSLPSPGNSDISISQGSAFIGRQSAAKLGECLLFRSTLQDARRNSADSLLAQWDTSRAAEIPLEQDRPSPLPEPGSGLLLSIGLSTLIYLSRASVLRQN